jgi:uncharacterized protein YjbI with pentapeptide repeats
MANEEHLKILRQGVDVWNKWRKDNPTIHPELSGAYLMSHDLRGAALMIANLAEADLRAAKLSDANLYGANLTRANLGAAELTRTNLGDAHLVKTNLQHAKLSQAKLERANLEEAILIDALDVRLDANLIRNARFSPYAKDPWSVLRRSYTGSRFALHLLLLLAFVIPYLIRAVTWVGANEAQVMILSTANKLEDFANNIKTDEPRKSALIHEIASELSKPCLSRNCKETAVWRILTALDREPQYWILVMALWLYNLSRGILTWRVSPLREEEERSGYCPRYRRKDGYGWLIPLHKTVQALIWVAVTSVLYHAWDWLSRPVWIRI